MRSSAIPSPHSSSHWLSLTLRKTICPGIGGLWAGLCGILATHTLPPSLLTPLLLLFLVDPIWGSLWDGITTPAWHTLLPLPQTLPPSWLPPFFQKDGPGATALRYAKALTHAYRERIARGHSSPLTQITVALIAALALSLILGPRTAWATAGAIATMLLAWRDRLHGREIPPILQTSISLTWPWLAGQSALAPLKATSALTVALLTPIALAIHILPQTPKRAYPLIHIPYLLLLCLAAWQARPTTAVLIGLSWFAQTLLLVDTNLPPKLIAQRSTLPLALTMLVAALGIW